MFTDVSEEIHASIFSVEQPDVVLTATIMKSLLRWDAEYSGTSSPMFRRHTQPPSSRQQNGTRGYEERSLLTCDAVWSGSYFLTFRRSVLNIEIRSSETSGKSIYQTTRCHPTIPHVFQGFFSSPHVKTGSGSCAMGTGGPFPVG
jgi:hypothetical protein